MFRAWPFFLVLAVSVGLWVPLTHVDWFQNFDLEGYIVRSVEWAQELRTGNLYPRWAPDMYGGFGEPLFVFFAPAVYAVSGTLTALSIDPLIALKLIALGGSVIAGVGVYALIFGETRDPEASMLGAIAYLCTPYRLGDLYERGDFSEFCCIALLPVALAAYLAASREAIPFRARVLGALASLVHAAMILTHTILGLWGSLILGLVVSVRCLQLFRMGAPRRIAPLLVALGCAPGVAGAYVVPAMAYRGATHSDALISGFYQPQNHWLELRDLFTAHSYMFLKNFNCVGGLVATAVVVVLVGIALDPRRGGSALGWLALCLALVALTLPVGFAFWEPGRVPLSQFIQFPWRLLGPASLAASVALGIGVVPLLARLGQPSKTALVIAGSSALLFVMAWPYASGKSVPSTGIPRDPYSIRSQVLSATSADEFLPAAIDAPPRQARADLVRLAEHATVKQAWSDGSRHRLVLTAQDGNATVELSHYWFPGWQIQTASGPANAALDSAAGMLRVRLPRAGEYRLEIAYGQPRFAWLGFALTALSLLVLGFTVLQGSALWSRRQLGVVAPDGPPAPRVEEVA